jgi:platelet-activating factor acetylhydrolase IB subunit alpha
LTENSVCEKCESLEASLGTIGGGKNLGDGLPREPSKYTLQGHRARVTKIAFHPSYNVVASAGEDAQIKIWDYELGELERSLKGHVGMVNGIEFSPNG